MSDLIIKADVMDGMRSDLARLQREFENANENSDAVAEAVGHDWLAERVRNFAHNWDNRRKDLVEQLQTVQDNMKEIQDAFEEIDVEFANGLNGEG